MRTPGQNGSRERGFGTLKYERLYIDEIDDAAMLAKHAEDYRIEYNTIRPHEALAWNRPLEVHLGTADPPSPPFKPRNPCHVLDAEQSPASLVRMGQVLCVCGTWRSLNRTDVSSIRLGCCCLGARGERTSMATSCRTLPTGRSWSMTPVSA